MDEIVVKFAEIPIKIKSECGYMADFCREYLSDENPLFSVYAEKEKVEEEINKSVLSPKYKYAESLCLYREIAEKLPLYNGFVFHGAAIEYNGKAYLFTAPSGTGKTTHILLWLKYLGVNVRIINGDKPIIRLMPDGFYAFGTPYAGKEKYQNNISAKIDGICVLSQGSSNCIKRLDSDICVPLFSQTYRPKDNEAMNNTLNLLNELCKLPCYSFSCDVSETAVKTSFEALTGLTYNNNSIK